MICSRMFNNLLKSPGLSNNIKSLKSISFVDVDDNR